MTEYTLHTSETAPEGSRRTLIDIETKFGFLPNLHRVLAESPQTLTAYMDLARLFQDSSLNSVEQNVVWMTVNYENNCTYCIPAHTMVAYSAGVEKIHIENLREGRPLTDKRLETLREFTQKLIEQRGNIEPDQTRKMREQGFTSQNILDVLVGVAHKTISNYANHLSGVKPDEAFSNYAWTHPDYRSG